MIMNGKQEIFKGKTFSDLLEDIYVTSRKKEQQINALIKELKPMIKSIGDATVVVPLIKEYMEVSVKNDEHLVKMAAVVQRAMARTGGDNSESMLLTKEEKQQLLDSVNEMQDSQ
jgi:hypothetical protein